jgi:hypothetical protein
MTFKAYLRCKAPNKNCFNCEFLQKCKELNEPEMLKPKVSDVQSMVEQHYKTKMQIITLPADGPEIYKAVNKFLYEQVPFFHAKAEIIISVRFPLPGSKFPLMAKELLVVDEQLSESKK